MALLYPWATKEYLLWEISIGQIIMYHNIGIEMKYPDASKPSDPDSLATKSPADLRKYRDDLKRMRIIDEEAKQKEASDKLKAEKYGPRYGDV